MSKNKSTIRNGDLVRVIHLPPHKDHFPYLTGVVCDRDARGAFFILEVDAKGKVVPGTEVGWYRESNVEVLCEQYYTKVPVYKEFDFKSMGGTYAV